MGWKEKKKTAASFCITLWSCSELSRGRSRGLCWPLSNSNELREHGRARDDGVKKKLLGQHFTTLLIDSFGRDWQQTHKIQHKKNRRVNKKKFSWSKSKDYLVCSILCCVFTGEKSRETVINLKCFNFTFFVRCDTESVIIQMRSRLVSWKFNEIR